MRKGKNFAAALVVSLGFAWGTHGQEPAVPPAVPQAPEAGTSAVLPASEKANPGGLYLFGEVLYVRPTRDNLQTALLANASGVTTGIGALSWAGTPGFRLGAGYKMADTGWDVETAFAYFHAKSQHTFTAPDGGSLSPVLTANPAALAPESADGDSGLSYGVLDLDVGRSCCNDASFRLRLFGGVRVAVIDQSLKCVYSGGSLGDGFDFVNSPVRFQGAGLTVGADSHWDIYHGWGLFGKARLGLVAGQFHSVRSETLDSGTLSNLTDTFATVVPVAELAVGLRYQGERFFFSAGYELTNWFNMVDGLNAPEVAGGQAVRRQGSLTLEAVTLRLGFAF